MESKIVLLFSLIFFTFVDCQNSSENLYDKFVENVINYNGIRTKVKESLANIDGGEVAALKMFDASSKIPYGLATGNAFSLGDYDGCLDIKLDDIYGKYCLGTISFGEFNGTYAGIFQEGKRSQQMSEVKPGSRMLNLGKIAGLHFAVCVPSTWSAFDIPGELSYTEDFCYSRATTRELTTGAIVVTVVLAIFLIIIIASTIFDIYINYYNKELPHEILISFSFLSNGRKLFKSSTNPDQLLCLNGIKAISMMWIVIFHEYGNARNGPVSNIYYLQRYYEDSENMFIAMGNTAVDTFFVVGGLVAVYTFLKSAAKRAKFNIIHFYIHRYLRLTPVLAILVLIHLFLLNYLSDGPLWKVVDLSVVQTCERAWWSTLLYITNYVNRGNCISPTWYLSVDMQLFILSPIVLLPLSKWPKVGLGALGFLTTASIIICFVIAFVDKVAMIPVGEQTSFTSYYYKQTYARFGPYVIGMILGYYIYRVKMSGLKVRLSTTSVCCLWLLCISVLVACIYAGAPLFAPTEEDTWGNSIFIAFQRPGWSVALCGVIFLCVTGYGGPIDTFLSLPIFQFLTKVSYCTYLIHHTVITVRHSSLRNTFKHSHLTFMHDFWGDFMFTLLLSVIFSLAFESPVVILEKYIFGRGKIKPVEKKTVV